FLTALNARGGADLLDRGTDPPADIELAWTLSSASDTKALAYELGFMIGKPGEFPSGFFIDRERLRYAQPTEGKGEPYWFFERPPKSPGKGSFAVRDKAKKQSRLVLDVSSQDAVFQQLEDLLKHPRFYKDFYPNFERVTRDVRAYFGGFREFASAEI